MLLWVAAWPHKLLSLPEQNRKQNLLLAMCFVVPMNRSTVFSDTDWHKGITWNPGPECSYKEEEECGDTMDCWNGEQQCCNRAYLFLSTNKWTFSSSLVLHLWHVDIWYALMSATSQTKHNFLSAMMDCLLNMILYKHWNTVSLAKFQHLPWTGIHVLTVLMTEFTARIC